MVKAVLFKKPSPTRSVFRWFLVGFVSFSLIFCVALLPLISYCRGVFTELEIKKSTQQMDFGINQLENAFTTVANASRSIYDDSRFYALHYANTDYSEISAVVCNQMKDYLGSLMRPCDLIVDSALQLSEKDAVTPLVTTFGGWAGYYPFYFRIDDLSYEEWETILKENRTGYLPIHRVITPYNNYDALIYSVQWSKDKYFYACLDINGIRKVLIPEEYLSDYRVTIENGEGTCLYTDLTDSNTNYHSVSQKTGSGELTVIVHIPNTILTERMQPLYTFLEIYLTACALVLIVTILVGTHLSTRPLAKIIDSLEKNRQPSAMPIDAPSNRRQPIGYGFHYIQNQIQSYESNLQQYEATLDTQTKVLQARFMEKALHGSLSSAADFDAFFSYFPNFPDSYRLILMGLSENPTENGNLYPNPLAIIQYYLQQTVPHAYLQQLTTHTLLLIIAEDEADTYSDTINHLIENINREEPCYHAWGIVSKTYSHPKDIPFAYLQMQDLRSKISTETLSRLCAVSDFKAVRKTGFQMSDTTVIYSAITNGNSEVALTRLQSYAEPLSRRNRSVFEMLRSILLCIKQDFADLLIDAEIPFYQPQGDLYTSLEECIINFCLLFQSEKSENTDSFAQQVKAYIDLHFAEEDLCSTSLEEHFQCSFVKIRKSFSKEVGTPITAYIEAKRMTLANELLIKGEDSVAEVARKCGFINYNTFLKAYRRTYGYAPSSVKQE
ncbi:MAG: helix-turn-helix transcriptional regulator [Lachnospiraceae bacterium]|nr:helix-turn-helix transcriptional regulator [Lachnospiraceae bacterium]